MSFKGRDIIRIEDLKEDEIYKILDVAERMVPVARGEETSDLLYGKVLASMFFEPSTRTRLSFETAMHRLGGSVITISGQEGTSLKKGETLADTIRMAEGYSDVVVLRHPNEGAAALAAHFCSKPVINGGDGAGQHPTQTLLDLFTIRKELGEIRGKTVALVGDLRYGRTVHSLSLALARLGAKMIMVAPELIQMPSYILEEIEALGGKYEITESLERGVEEADVLYVTRIQRERFPDEEEYRKVAGSYRITKEGLEGCKEHMIIMHPLPRVDEISPEVDLTPHAKYFIQAFNGVPVRMAILSLVLGVIE
ncbi:MAG: aspartate carbamoyltransferase [Thermoplasmata archaeon]|nr:aspartate carbamoyltransferase [Thermoplasmata archaeon]HDD60854.1 aspartate carbamoyltransferase [Euryarchaeota archaeon]RLF55243.1 MAG: aspartate carbamoyltransferase [Thermoplasmata archaeon]RLF71947.1 MAG: aspartate carbamoyltransferase [Thermoplasmata archaeon]RLF73774.1 MAG: aspartate carbamoyltransferase [Thermoplasmata archaeon]